MLCVAAQRLPFEQFEAVILPSHAHVALNRLVGVRSIQSRRPAAQVETRFQIRSGWLNGERFSYRIQELDYRLTGVEKHRPAYHILV